MVSNNNHKTNLKPSIIYSQRFKIPENNHMETTPKFENRTPKRLNRNTAGTKAPPMMIHYKNEQSI